jgi:predicted small integral membrane protein
LGGVIFPIMVVHLIPEIGFGWTMRTCAFLILALLLFANLTVTSRIRPTRRPFSVMAFIRPLKEPSFALLTSAIFLFYWGMFVGAYDSALLFHQKLIEIRFPSPS